MPEGMPKLVLVFAPPLFWQMMYNCLIRRRRNNSQGFGQISASKKNFTVLVIFMLFLISFLSKQVKN